MKNSNRRLEIIILRSVLEGHRNEGRDGGWECKKFRRFILGIVKFAGLPAYTTILSFHLKKLNERNIIMCSRVI